LFTSLCRITTRDVLDVLAPIWSRAPETASRLRGRIETVLDAERALRIGKGDGDEKPWRNPAQWRGNLEPLLPKKSKQAKALGLGGHFAALPYADVPAFMARLRVDSGVVARAFEFLVLTAGRTGEVLGAKWDEFDLDRSLWTIPGHRMKAGKPHSVPLSARAIAILRELEALGSDYVFPGHHGALSNMVFLMLLRRMWTPSCRPLVFTRATSVFTRAVPPFSHQYNDASSNSHSLYGRGAESLTGMRRRGSCGAIDPALR
jgi:integrase